MQEIEELIKILKTLHQILQDIYSIGGFSLFISAIGIYILFRILSVFFPSTPKTNLLLSGILYTLLWILWQKYYQGNIELSPIFHTYKILLIPVLGILFLRFLLFQGIKFLKRKFFPSSISQDQLLISIQKLHIIFTEKILEGRKKEALNVLEEMKDLLQKSSLSS